MAEVNDTGEITVEGTLIGRLEGFRFRPDKTSNAEETQALPAATIAALAPAFHLRADRFYNAPDTEIDYTEQGGLMWGKHAIGKLVRSDDALAPQVQAFVDDEAGAEAAEKVKRRLQHFFSRKVATMFEPLLLMSRDESLEGLARGVASRLVEAMGLIPRTDIASDVKALDQDARGALRKHGVRFGQFTIFMPLLLKPAPTRLRLVLSGLFEGASEFPESPPPGLVTIPAPEGVSDNTHRLSGYRKAGARAIRIDMLERLADQLRDENSRAGFEANPDMLSITGMTLEQFADLMQGLGYKAVRGEREKVKAAVKVAIEAEAAEVAEAAPETEELKAEEEIKAEDNTPKEAEKEVFYTFTWGQFGAQEAKARRQATKPDGKAKTPGGKPKSRRKGKPDNAKKPGNSNKSQARPPKYEKPIDPDNPFAAALMGLKDKI